MKDALYIIQIISGALLVLFILLQVKGTGFGRVWGSGGSNFSRRGVERLVYKLTFVVGGIFILVSTLQLFV